MLNNFIAILAVKMKGEPQLQSLLAVFSQQILWGSFFSPVRENIPSPQHDAATLGDHDLPCFACHSKTYFDII